MTTRKEVARKGAERVREVAEHFERLSVNAMTGGSIEHLSNAGSALLKAVDRTMQDMSIPEETKKHLLTAERETLLAVKGFLDAAIKEIDRIEKGGKKPSKQELKKIKIE